MGDAFGADSDLYHWFAPWSEMQGIGWTSTSKVIVALTGYLSDGHCDDSRNFTWFQQSEAPDHLCQLL
jgi:hypothetical protein